MLRYSSSPEQEKVTQLFIEIMKKVVVPKLIKISVSQSKPFSMEQIENIIYQMYNDMEKDLSMPKIGNQAKKILIHSIVIGIYPFYIKQLKYNI